MADRDQLDRALARLEPEARAVVVLHFYLDLPLPRVADDARHPGRYREVAPPPLARDACAPHVDRRGGVAPGRRRSEGRSDDHGRPRASTASSPGSSSSSLAPAHPTTSRPPSSAPRPDPSVPRGRTPEGGFPWTSRPRRSRPPGCRGVSSASSPSSASSSPWPPSPSRRPPGSLPSPAVRPGRERRHRDGEGRRHLHRRSARWRPPSAGGRSRGRQQSDVLARRHAARLRAPYRSRVWS